MRIARVTLVAFALVVSARVAVSAQAPAAGVVQAPPLSVAEQEEFLLKAKIVRAKGASKGITGTLRLTLTDGRLTHDASFQAIDEYMQRFEGTQGVEFNFRDSWRYNVAAYRLDRLLELDMIPPSVDRVYNGKHGSLTWWVDDVMMDEAARLKKKIDAPDTDRWNEQMWHVRMFDQLIYNVDRNLGNLVIDNNWTIWMIDHSRAFRLYDTLKSEGNLAKVDRKVLDRLKALDKATLTSVMKDYLVPGEISALLARRDVIVRHYERINAIFDWQRPPRPPRSASSSQ